VRIGVYSDLLYRRDAIGTISTHQAFIRFVLALRPLVDELVVFGRLAPEPDRSHYELPPDVRFVPLPHYASVTEVSEQVRCIRATTQVFIDVVSELDAVWVFGPHPMSLSLVLAARRHKVPLFLGVRQDYPEYIKGRLPSKRWRWAVPVAHLLEQTYRAIGRRAPTVAVGDSIAAHYRHDHGPPVLSTRFALVNDADVSPLEVALARPWTAPIRVLCVGRLATEKNPLLLADIAAQLRRDGGAWRILVAGDGPLAADLEARAAMLGVDDMVELIGYVPSGPPLWDLYRSSHVVLHVSLTEGVPQVVSEAQAAGLPVVATDVGGVRASFGDGSVVLVPPNDAPAAARALERIGDDPQMREALVRGGLENAKNDAIERNMETLVRFFADGIKWYEQRGVADRPRNEACLRSRPSKHSAVFRRGTRRNEAVDQSTGDPSADPQRASA
jgi:glycosyltransferase involved in cell wall biosynthesis